MGILKDWISEYGRARIDGKVEYFLSPRVWYRLHKTRKQRADRGWADSDAWGAGEHIVNITSEMIKTLRDYGCRDWEWTFKNQVGGSEYKNLDDLVADLDGYIEFNRTRYWHDGLELKNEYDSADNILLDIKNSHWVSKETGRALTEKQVTARMKKHNNEERRHHRRAVKAMIFFSRNFELFWD